MPKGSCPITIACYDGSVTSLYRLGQGAEEKKQIRIAAVFGGDEWKEYAAEYCRRHPDTEITVECGTPGDAGEIFTNQVMAQILSGEGPDILIVNRGQLETFQEKGVRQRTVMHKGWNSMCFWIRLRKLQS